MSNKTYYGACVYSNVTLYGLKEDVGARYLWTCWRVFVLLSSLFGDTTILVASIKYRAIKIHQGLVPFMQHLAVCDLILSTTYVLPGIVSLVADEWVLGDGMCLATAYLSYFAFSLNCFLISGMTSGKLMMIVSPMKAREWTKMTSHRICLAIWMFCLCLPLTQYLIDGDDGCFDSRKYNCTYGYSPDIWAWFKPILFFFMALAPGITVFVTSVLLLLKASQVARESLKWQGVLTVLITSGVYSVSILPFVANGIAEPFLEKDPLKVGKFQFRYYRVACAFLSFQIMANFYIYNMTVPSLRQFVLNKIFGRSNSHLNLKLTDPQNETRTSISAEPRRSTVNGINGNKPSV
ncbi:hypothetical protein ACHWQZ_G016377 [Mnemiopsis leidyi]